MKNIIFILLTFVLTSCNKEVQLAQANSTIDSLVTNHSPVYMFYKTKGDSVIVDVNNNNTISTTNWIFNIDKRLPLKLVIPEIAKLQQKRKEAKLHKNENALNYFTYTDTIKKSLAFYSFKDVFYSFSSYFSTFYIKENISYHKHFQNFTVNFKPNNRVTVDGNEVKMDELMTFIKEYIQFSSQNKRALIYLNFDENLLFNDYLSKVVMLNELKSEMVSISETHFIYDLKKLPDCNCTL